jgi:hypothetical protein
MRCLTLTPACDYSLKQEPLALFRRFYGELHHRSGTLFFH